MVKGMGFEPIQWTSPCTDLVCRILAGCRSTLELPSHKPSLRPPALSRVVRCFRPTDLLYRVVVLWNNLRSHLLWLCDSAESGLINSVGWDFRPSLLHLYYTTKLAVCQEVLEKFLKNFCGILRSTRTIFELTCTVPSPLDTYIISQLAEKVNPFLQKSCTNLHRANPNFLCKLPGRARARTSLNF